MVVDIRVPRSFVRVESRNKGSAKSCHAYPAFPEVRSEKCRIPAATSCAATLRRAQKKLVNCLK
jgi:hypothetical protein